MEYNGYLLRSLADSLNSPASEDKIVILRDVTLNASGEGSIDMSKLVKEGAKVSYFVARQATVTSNAIEVSSDAPQSLLVTVGIIVDQNDLAML